MTGTAATSAYDDGPLAGTSQAPVMFAPSAPVVGPAPLAPEVKLPRPSLTRLPIDAAAFAELKSRARSATPLARRPRLTGDRSPEHMLPAQASAVAPPGAPITPAAPAVAGVPATPNVTFSYAGNAFTGWIPYDCAMAAGPQHVLLAVNSTVSILPRTGGAALVTKTLSAWFNNVLVGVNVFDPRAVYDHLSNRWILVAGAYNAAFKSWLLLSVSQTADPTGQWLNYALDATVDGATQTNNWADYPAVGYDQNAIYLTANMFVVGGQFAYAKLRVVDKAVVYAGAKAAYQDFVGLRNGDNSLAFTVQPCVNLDGGSTEYLVNTLYPDVGSPEKSQITLWTVTGAPGAPRLTSSTVATSSYAVPPNADQPGGAAPLESGDIRILSATFRNGSVWTCLTTRHTWDDGSNTAAIYWLELDPAAQVRQDAVYGAMGRHYFYPAIIPDGSNNALLAFARVSVNEHAAIYVAARRSTDAIGSMSPSVQIHPGASPYVSTDGAGRNRWGDYFGIAADPNDNALLWSYGGYAASMQTWAVWVCAAKA